MITHSLANVVSIVRRWINLFNFQAILRHFPLIASRLGSKLVLNETVLELVIESADRVRVRGLPKAEYEYEKPGFRDRKRIEDTGDQQEVSNLLVLLPRQKRAGHFLGRLFRSTNTLWYPDSIKCIAR